MNKELHVAAETGGPSPDRSTRDTQPKAQGYTDGGGLNMFYEGRFDGETEREQKARLQWAEIDREIGEFLAVFDEAPLPRFGETGSAWKARGRIHQIKVSAAVAKLRRARLLRELP